MARKIYSINGLANQCGYFYNAYLEKDVTVNNGYNCRHTEQTENETIKGQKIGACHAFSCPLAYEADEEDFANPDIDKDGYDIDDFEEGDFVVVDE